MTFVHADEGNAQEPGPSGDHVVVLAPKRGTGTAQQQVKSSFLDHALQRRTTGPSGRRPASSPSPPPSGRRRASPSYDTFRPRGSPTYEPHPAAHTAAAEPAAATAAARGSAAAGAAKEHHVDSHADRSRSPDGKRKKRRASSRSSRSKSRSRSRSRKRKRSRRSKSRSRSSSRRRRHRSSSRHKRSRQKHGSSRSRSRSRGRSRDRRYKRSRRSRSWSRGRGRSHERYRERHGRTRYSSSSRSRSPNRGRGSSRGRSPHAARFSSRERAEAWREQRQALQQVRRGKQGLGFAPAAAAAAGPDSHRGHDSSRNSSEKRAGSKGVSVVSAAASIPGYSCMTPAEQLKARMRLVMARADQHNAVAAGNEDADDAGAGGSGGWTRFVLDRHGALDEDKQAMQQLLDEQVGQAGFAGGSTADIEGEASAAFIMGTGRAAARKAAAKNAAEQAHEDAIFGGGAYAAVKGSQQAQQQQQQQQQASLDHQELKAVLRNGADYKTDEGASLGLAEGLFAQQQKGMSWRERALAKRQQQQQQLL